MNAFYNPQVAIKLKNLISYLPLWTGFMRSNFQCDKIIATSSAVEATFADLKHRTFKGELPMRIDKFVIKHIDSLQAKTLLAFADGRVACKDTTMENERNLWNVVENWRGLTVKNRESSVELDQIQNKRQLLSKKQKVTYLDDCPNWDDMKTLKRITIPLFKNGSLLKASRCYNFIAVRKTCAFDSLTQVVTNIIVTNEAYHNIIMNEITTLEFREKHFNHEQY